jgi:hypothetical protein
VTAANQFFRALLSQLFHDNVAQLSHGERFAQERVYGYNL